MELPITMLSEGAKVIVGEAAEGGRGFWRVLRRQRSYLKNLKQNFKDCEKAANHLHNQVRDIKALSNDHLLEVHTHVCEEWLNEVAKMTRVFAEMENTYQTYRRIRWFSLSKLSTRRKLSKELLIMTQTMTDQSKTINLADRNTILQVKCWKKVPKFPMNISAIPSLQKNVAGIIQHLNEAAVTKIGVWGTSGVGKTTILETLNEELEKLNMFDIVLWVTVSKTDSLNHAKQTILKQVTSTVHLNDEPDRAVALISNYLENMRYLLILDGLSSKIDLGQLGIHDHHKHGKVVLAATDKAIFYEMDTHHVIKVERMSTEDAHELFHRVVGEVGIRPNLNPIAEKIIRYCGGHPQVIKAVGNHLKRVDKLDMWQSTLTKLQFPNVRKMKCLEEFCTPFSIIYEELPDHLQKCILYGASFPADHKINRDHLVECWTTEGLIAGQSWKKSGEEGYAILEGLADKCLYDRCQDVKHVKMPIIVRNTAIGMAESTNLGLVIADKENLEEHISPAKWKRAKVMSLMNCDVSVLPESPDCPMISALFLQGNALLSTISASFFKRMNTLTTLDLYDAGIAELPPSVSELSSLRGLYLNGCRLLKNLPNETENLQKLKLLDICGSGVIGFPSIIGTLQSLQCLRVSFTTVSGNKKNESQAVMSPTIFETLVHLEELAIVVVKSNDPRWNNIALETATKVANLRSLSAITFYFPDTESLKAFVKAIVSRRSGTRQEPIEFRSFNIYVGSHSTDHSSQIDISKCSGRGYFQYSGGGEKDMPIAIIEVLKRACAFELINHKDIERFSDLHSDTIKLLEICMIKGCGALKVILESSTGGSALAQLQELYLLNLPQLSHIAKGPIPPNSLNRLRKLKLDNCPQMSQAISWEMAKELNSLEELSIENCSGLTEIFEQSYKSTICPKLQILELINLEVLVSIHTGGSTEWNGSQKIIIKGCDQFNNLCLNETNATKIRNITCSNNRWAALNMSDEIRPQLLPFFFGLDI